MTMLLEEVLPYLRKGRKAVSAGLVYRIHNGELQRSINGNDWTASSNPFLDKWSLVPEQFDFLEAVRRMQAGKKVRRASWGESHWNEDNRPGVGSITNDYGNTAGNSSADFLATDWQEVEP